MPKRIQSTAIDAEPTLSDLTLTSLVQCAENLTHSPGRTITIQALGNPKEKIFGLRIVQAAHAEMTGKTKMTSFLHLEIVAVYPASVSARKSIHEKLNRHELLNARIGHKTQLLLATVINAIEGIVFDLASQVVSVHIERRIGLTPFVNIECKEVS